MELRNIDIVSANCICPNDAVLAIKQCCKYFEFGRKILFTNSNVQEDGVETIKIKKLSTVDEYNDFILSLGEYVNNEYVLVVQDDGYIINPKLWTDEFFQYDYIGAPWPTEETWIDCQLERSRPFMRNVFPKNRVGNGGFSLRSKRFLEYSLQFESCDGFGEDTFLCVTNYEKAIESKIKFAEFELASRFSYENPCIEFGTPWNSRTSLDIKNHFGFHGKNFINTSELLSLKHK